jgi:CRISPR-associated exonuclease Cas4
MRELKIERAAMWYWEVRQREWVDLDDALREETERVISQVHELFASRRIPPPIYGTHCRACSLKDDCKPQVMQRDKTDQYLRDLFTP